MDLAEDTNFAFKHPYFFENYTFKFENLKAEVKENFENIVKSLGATLSDESQYVFTDIMNTSLNPNKNYYSLSYFLNSILAEEPLEIEDYKFSNLVQDSNESGFCDCIYARYIWKTKSCINYINKNFCCKSCIEKRGLLRKRNNQFSNQVNGSTNKVNTNYSNEERDLYIEETNHLQGDTSTEMVNNLPFLQYEIDHLNLAENSNDVHIAGENHNAAIQSPTNVTYHGNEMNEGYSDAHVGGENHNTSNQSLTNSIPQENELNENSRDSDDLEIIEIQSNLHLEEPSCSAQNLKKPKTNKSSSINKWKRVPLVQDKIDNLNVSEDEDSNDAHIDGENHNTSVQSLTNGQENEVNENSDSSDLEMIEIHPNGNLEEPSCSTPNSKKSKTNKSSNDRWRRIRTVSSNSDTDSESSDVRNPTRNRKNKRQRLSSPSVESTSNKSSVEATGNNRFSLKLPSKNQQDFIERINTSMNREQWWTFLPTPKENKNYTVPATKSRGRGRDFTYGEKKLMIAYLVVYDEIDDGTSRRPWKQMIMDGYIQGRTAESLNNHYRKVLLPAIETFKLPKEIERKFIENRKLHKRA